VTEQVSTIGVVGAGTMGAGIALTAARSGFDVQLIDAEDQFVQRGLDRITSELDKAVDRGNLSEADRDATLTCITGSTGYEQLAGCDLVIEAVPETLAIKQPVLMAISESVDESCIIASNTSSLGIHDLSTFITNPGRMIGMHFFNPVPRMELVEVIAADSTAEETVKAVADVARRMGKAPVLSADNPGFIVNRVLIPMINEAILALQEEVASAEDIDTAMKLGAAHPMGPLSLADLIGLDVVLEIMRVLESAFGDKYAPAQLLLDMVAAGRLGRKSGNGFFSYEGGR
jgi:3-hydroxybutyryl-CoA dehydrogenase